MNASSQTEVKIRPFPYPYKAALAICNDLDGITTFEEMKAIHDVLNGQRDTPCGPGLGLEVGDSFHFYTAHPEKDDTWSYFQGITDKPSEYAPAMREGMACGLLDTMHTWGNFSQKGGFFRRHAQRACEELDKYGLKIPVWTNHGDIHNFQNLARMDSLGDLPQHSSQRGDRSSVLEYHLDIARKAGIRYIWVKELTEIIGQERPLEPADWLKKGVVISRSAVKNFLQGSLASKTSLPLTVSNDIIKLLSLRDGSVLYQVLRYGSFKRDGADNIAEVLNSKCLGELVRVGGATLLYIHLGKGRISPDKPFSDESYSALALLASWANDGEIWVTTTARLCRHMELKKRLKLLPNVNNSGVVGGQFEQAGELEAPDVSGLCFYYNDESEVSLKIGDNLTKMAKNPKDHTGRISFSVPLKPLPYPWE